jgi:hypothetical protein
VFTPTGFVILAKDLPEPAELTEDPDVSTLVDEYSDLPVFDPTKLYPIKIDVNNTNQSR